jgi:hypothetical protein
MTALILEAKLFAKTDAHRRFLQAADHVAADATRLIVLSLLGMACALSSVGLVLSVCIAMPVLTEQFAAWLRSGQWDAVPLAMVFARMGYAPGSDASTGRMIADWFLSLETGVVLLAAASVFGCTVWIFEKARSRPTARLSSRPVTAE